MSGHAIGPRGPRRAAWLRWAMLVVGLLFLAVGIVWLFAPSMIGDKTAEQYRWFFGAWFWGTPVVPTDDEPPLDRANAVAAIYLGVVLITQYLFLLPRGSWRLRLTGEGRPMILAAVGAGFIAMVITVGAIASLLTFGKLWAETLESIGSWWPVWVMMALWWTLWTVLLWRYWRDMDHPTAVARTMRWLIGGTILEMLIAGPVHVWIAREDECFCARGSYTGLVFGLTAVVWLFGPGVWLLFLRERRRRRPLVDSQGDRA